jgi:hypothetical protein
MYAQWAEISAGIQTLQRSFEMKETLVLCLIAALFLSRPGKDFPKKIFGKYPADYPIAYFETAGVSGVPAVLLTANNPGTEEETKRIRMQAAFQSDSMTERSREAHNA